MKKRLVIAVVLALALVLVLSMTVPAMAKPGDSQGKLVLNITYKVTNDEDSGFVGYWALSDYNRLVQVWQTGADTYYVVSSYEGRWHTFEGALSPMDGVEEGADASGTFQGGYTATFTYDGQVNPNGDKAKGNIGAFDFGGTKEDILLGTYGAGQTGATSPYSWLGAYFPGAGNFHYGDGDLDWSWTYHYQGQTWVNSGYGSSGDIIVP